MVWRWNSSNRRQSDMAQTTRHNPASVHAPSSGYSMGLELSQHRRLLFISGQVPERSDGSLPEGFEAQCEQAWRNVIEVLAAADLGVEHLVKINTCLTDRTQVTANRAASRMSDFFMRLMGFMAISRVLRRHGVSLSVIGEIERETYKAQLLTVPGAERLASGRQFMSSENQTLLREQAAKSATKSHQKEFPEDFVYDFVEPGPSGNFEFGINYKACGFCKFAARHGDKEILPNICGLDFDAYATGGIHLARTQTLAGGANHCNF